ncbi:MAG: ribosome hibernation-promoting factor, HPF/YfiA family [Actinomycetota bacterium]
MEIVVTGRHMEVKDRFRRHLEEKLAKVTQVAPRARRVDVVISHRPHRRQPESSERVEITCIGKGPVVRAEATAEDLYAAFDRAHIKLVERLRRMHDRKIMRRGRSESLAQASARMAPQPEEVGVLWANSVRSENGASSELAQQTAAPMSDEGEREDIWDGSPVQIREKVHATHPMSVDQAVHEMELVGHDFYLFSDAESGRPSVAYRRRGWEYGVLHLDVLAAADGVSEAGPIDAAMDHRAMSEPVS